MDFIFKVAILWCFNWSLLLCGVNGGKTCHLEFRVETEDPGCDICLCCRRNSEYTVDCANSNLTRIPRLPLETTVLDMSGNPVVQHLHKHSFPHLPNLLILSLTDRRERKIEQHPVLSAHPQVFHQLPRMLVLRLSLKMETVTKFLRSAKVLKYLHLLCMEDMTQQQYKLLFSHLELTSLKTWSCNYQLREKTFSKTPEEVTFITYETTKSQTGAVPNEVRLPGSNVSLQYNNLVKSMDVCLNLSAVFANRLLISCGTGNLDITPNNLKWIGSTNAKISLQNPATSLKSIQLGSHNFESLQMSFSKSKISVTGVKDFENRLVSGLKNSFTTRFISKTSFNWPDHLSPSFLSNLIGPRMRELQLTNYAVGNMKKIHFNLTHFRCNECRISCAGCDVSENLRQLMIVGHRSTFATNTNRILVRCPHLEDLRILTRSNKRLDLNLFSHSNIRHIELGGISGENMQISNSHLNLSRLVNLEDFTLQNVKVYRYSTQVNLPSNSSRLEKLVYLSFNNCEFQRQCALDMENLFQNLVSLRVLKLVKTPFWGSVERLKSILLRVSSHLELLDLTANGIQVLPTEPFRHMTKLRLFFLEQNLIRKLDGCVFSTNALLTGINFRQNQLATVSGINCLSKLEYLRKIDLRQNQIKCNCDNRQLRNFIQVNLRSGITSVTHDKECYVTDKSHKMAPELSAYVLPWINCDFHMEEVVIGTTVSMLCLLVIAIYSVHYYRYDILFWWVVKRRRRINRQRSVHPARIFHAFLSYSSSEQLLAEYIFFQLEENEDIQFKIAYDCRDFLPLYDIADNIIRCIDHSEKVIFLISRRFLEREWCQFEMNFAQMRCFDERKNVIILIFVEKLKTEDLPQRLRILCRHVNYLEYPDPANQRAMRNFWHRLRLALAQDSEIETNTQTDGEPAEGDRDGRDDDDDDAPLLGE